MRSCGAWRRIRPIGSRTARSWPRRCSREVPTRSRRTTVAPLNGLTSRGEPGRVPCPSCGAPIPAGREHAGSRLRCTRCQAVSYLQILSKNTLQLKLVEHPPVSVGTGAPIIIDAPDDEVEPDPSAATLQVAEARRRARRFVPLPVEVDEAGSGIACWTRRIALGALAVLAIAGRVRPGSIAAQHDSARAQTPGDRPASSQPRPRSASLPSCSPAGPPPSRFNIAYGTEKQKWLEEATAEFAKTPAGGRIKVNLHGMGSVEGAQAVLERPEPRSDPRLVAGQQRLSRPLRAGMAGQPQEQPDRQEPRTWR